MVNILIAVLVFGFLILIHEFGHYITARIFKVSIKEAAIGMGPKLISRKAKKTGIVYSLRLFPIGGFVSMVGEDEASDDAGALNRKPVWQRLIITVAGAAMNFLLGIILMCILAGMAQSIGSTTIYSFQTEDAKTQQEGLMAGDKIVKIGNKNVHIATDLVYTVMHDATEPVDVTVIRDGERIVISDVEFPTTVSSSLLIGTVDFYVVGLQKTPVNVVRQAYYQSCSSIRMIWDSFGDLLSGKYGVEEVSGPVGVTSAIGDAAEEGAYDLLYLCALISLNLGIVNLLPLPALDGGRVLFLLIELVRRKPVKPEIEGYVHFAGIVLLMVLMVLITFKDVFQLITK